jgi:dihydroorotase
LIQQADEVINAEGLHLLPGCIDDQVHFREPGLTYKADIYSESRAAVPGYHFIYGDAQHRTQYLNARTLLEDKYEIASRNSLANYSFLWAHQTITLDEVLRTDTSQCLRH